MSSIFELTIPKQRENQMWSPSILANINGQSNSTSSEPDSYTKAETDVLLASKANIVDVYSKTETDTLLATKANTTTVNSQLALKADTTSVYTKTEVNNLLEDKANTDDVYSKTETYSKTEVDTLISNIGSSSLTITTIDVTSEITIDTSPKQIRTSFSYDASLAYDRLELILNMETPNSSFSTDANFSLSEITFYAMPGGPTTKKDYHTLPTQNYIFQESGRSSPNTMIITPAFILNSLTNFSTGTIYFHCYMSPVTSVSDSSTTFTDNWTLNSAVLRLYKY